MKASIHARMLALALLLVLAVGLDVLLWLKPWTQPIEETYLILHERPEMPFEDEPASFAETIRAALAAQHYDELETLATRLRDPNQRFRGGTSQIKRFYAIVTEYRRMPNETVCNEDRDPASFDAKRAQLEAWHDAVPDQPTASVALLELWVDAGIGSRGCAFSNELSNAQRAGMESGFARAQSYVEELDLDVDPVAYEEAIDMGMFAGWGRETLNDLYSRAIKAYPTYYALYGQHAAMLLHRWYGHGDELKYYLDGLSAPERGPDGQIAYAFTAFRLIEYYAQPDIPETKALTLPAILAAYQVREQRFGLRPHDWKALFYFSLHGGLNTPAHQAVMHMGTDWDSTIWRRREDFDRDIEWYKENTRYRDDIARLGG